MIIMYKNIESCKDGKYLIDNLNIENLNAIENILIAYNSNKINIIEPKCENGDFDCYGEFGLLVNDSSYVENGMETIVLKWYEDYEDTEYLIDYFNE